MSNVREGYLKDGWEQPRWLNHIALRAREPDEVAEFYTTALELEEIPEESCVMERSRLPTAKCVLLSAAAMTVFIEA